ncbi:hypothetical protein EJB05_30690 [Eragrostis curvula]|uniref:Uncharacterized protein n=1 Tax=Eragrostis curvula TaxID=38414 RepID=A0A5J9UBZ0_9POAL|nr:hypothetical protein EJB05_30690 [Eragrostis curvula]
MGTCCSRHKKRPPDTSSDEDGHAAPVVTNDATSGNNEAQPDTATTPHVFQEAIANEKSTDGTANILAGKAKKHWVDEKTGCNCFMLFPRGLSITWSEDPEYWNWHPFKEASDTDIETASLEEVCWLDIQGKQELSHLTPGVNYEVVFEVMLNKSASGWDVPVKFELKFPDGKVQQRKEELQGKPREQWLKLKVGEVKAQEGQRGEMEISMFEHGSQWKSGLIIKGIKIIPKT